METVIRNVEEIDAHDRQALEHVLGQELSENQQLVICIVSLQGPANAAHMPAPRQPEHVEWTEEDNARRCQLIDRKLQGLLTETEAGELAKLQEALREYVNQVAPLPFNAAQRLHAKLVQMHQTK